MSIFLKLCIRLLSKVSRKLVLLSDIYKPFIRTIFYKGIKLYYSKGTTIVEGNSANPVRFGGTYEPLETSTIVNALKKSSDPIFVDIGANIGLMAINVLHDVPHAKVFAFEPGLHQHNLFEKTIETNSLKERIVLSQRAIGAETGIASFSVHADKHSSGDGFLDTGRAGHSNVRSVSVVTLDNWWKSQNYPVITVIKMDIEGAELWALEGGYDLMSSCKPIIIFEIHPLNLQPYPYSASDILAYLKKRGYHLNTISGKSVSTENISETLIQETSFIATPITTIQ